MESQLPEHLRAEAKEVEEHIRRAFKGVTRAGGISWSGSVEKDNYESPEEIKAAASKDTETSWEELVDDPAWNDEPGIGGFNFLDAVGYRYYIAPAMVRCARRGYGEFIGYALTIDSDFRTEQINAITPPQARSIARFVRFMIKAHQAEGDDIYGPSWESAYRTYWAQFDTPPEGNEEGAH